MQTQINTNSSSRIKSLKIPPPLITQQVILTEEIDRDAGMIPSDTRLFCGHCGKQLGTTRNAVMFPFDLLTLMDILDNQTFTLVDLHDHPTILHNACKLHTEQYFGSFIFSQTADFFEATKLMAKHYGFNKRK